MPEIRCALEFLMFVKNNPDGFYGAPLPIFPFCIGMMKMSACIFAEIVNILIINESRTTTSVIVDFIAFGIIVEIDDVMLLTTKNIV